jgi:hypothetical protein
MTTARSSPLDAWYAAAWNHEFVRELAPQKICGKDLVRHRRADGEVASDGMSQ